MSIDKKRNQVINLSLSVALARQREVTEQETVDFLQEAGYSDDFSETQISEITDEINQRYHSAS